jgi:transglutaminase-like putative cysteine protease
LERDDLDTLIGTLGAVDHLDHRGMDWGKVRWTAYLIHQHLRYEYPDVVHDLRQRLMIVPPDLHGGQRLVTHKLEVSAPGVIPVERCDRFGNLVLELHVDRIEQAIDFTAWIVVEREARAVHPTVAPEVYADPELRQPSQLTGVDGALRAAATELRAAATDDLALARLINAWVHGQISYAYGITSVKTTAAEALAGKRGVCQDSAHIMLAICRACGLAARYVSGHLLGEGGTHAWVEVLLPHPDGAGYIAWPFDPTHGNEPGLNYITIAVGRDYGDVAPTSGTFRGPHGGRLSTHKRAGLTAVKYYAAD